MLVTPAFLTGNTHGVDAATSQERETVSLDYTLSLTFPGNFPAIRRPHRLNQPIVRWRVTPHFAELMFFGLDDDYSVH
jgi:hypothetical protein